MFIGCLTVAALCAVTLGSASDALASSPSLGGRALKQGMSGPDVRTLQNDLTQAGLRTPASGVFDAATEASVRRFARQHHLKAKLDGIVDASFVRELRSILAQRSQDATSVAARSGGATLGQTPNATARQRSRPHTPAGSPQASKTTAIKRGSDSKTAATKRNAAPKTTAKHSTAFKRSAAPKTATPQTSAVATPPTSATGTTAAPQGGVLRQGMSGPGVLALQESLTLAGFPTDSDGKFGPATKRNLIAFERAHKLKANGIADAALRTALQAVLVALDPGATVGGVPVDPGRPAGRAILNADGTATAPASAPPAIQAVIAAANLIASKRYIYGGGHGSWNDAGYDCSGSVSYALHGAGLISAPEDSGELESYGSPGRGHWITIWANAGHTYMYIAGLRFDTAAQGSTGGSRWSAAPASSAGYVVRHPTGL